MELELSKPQILELYLNRIYLSAGVYGVQTMSEHLFRKPASAITLPEAALIAGLIRAPSTLSPWSNYDGALERSHLVLSHACAEGSAPHAKQILLETIEYAKERKAFGQSIGSFQHNKFKIAELVTSIEVAEAYVDDCIEAHAEGRLSAVDAAKAKWWSAQVQNEILDACVQLHGGYGYMNEYRVARAWRDARVTKIWAGSNEIMKELIGRDLGL